MTDVAAVGWDALERATAEMDAALASASVPSDEPSVLVLVVDGSVGSVAAVLACAQSRAVRHVALVPASRRDEIMPIARRAFPRRRCVVVSGKGLETLESPDQPSPPGADRWDTKPAVDDGPWPPHALASTVATVCLFTSGSTGPPQAVAYTWDAWWKQTDAVLPALCGGDREHGTIVLTTPVAHAYALMGLLAVARRRWTVVIAPGGDALASWLRQPDATALHPITVLAAPAVLTRALLLGLPLVTAGAMQVHRVISAGCPLAPTVAAAWAATGRPPAVQNYGTTETGAISFGTGGPEPGNVGSPLGAAVSLLPPTAATEVPEGFGGEVAVRSPWRSLGYVLPGGRLVAHGRAYRTGDAGRWTDAGELVVGPRLRLLATVRDGPSGLLLRVCPGALERRWAALPGIRSVAVVPIANAKLGALVVLEDAAKAGADSASVLDLDAALPAPVRAAVEVRVVPALPTSAAGKVLLGAVAAAFHTADSVCMNA